ncbi:MAG: hypothetical protein M4579_003838 [Chaenotheca gracillima]|nr:MAG: hypothetical protein M4579_003838 [Chaenotheca gracillima]
MLAGGQHQLSAPDPPFHTQSSNPTQTTPPNAHRHSANIPEARPDSIGVVPEASQHAHQPNQQHGQPATTAPVPSSVSAPHPHPSNAATMRNTPPPQPGAANTNTQLRSHPQLSSAFNDYRSRSVSQDPSNSSNASIQHSPASGSTTVESATSSPTCIKVRDLSHIQRLASEDFIQSHMASSRRSRSGADEVGLKYEISAMPVADVIEMVAGLLTKITTTNDIQHEHLPRPFPPPDGTAGLSAQTSSVLAFHGKNVPSITILSYLSRIHKYCPTTYEVFLSLLVYFDRMTERVNAGRQESLRQANQAPKPSEDAQSQGGPADVRRTSVGAAASSRHSHTGQNSTTTPPPSGRLGAHEQPSIPSSPSIPPEPAAVDTNPYNLSNFFVVDSFNIHRLVIAGVTCASKFFSDVFYTNSRYAKVGGLPLGELNHLEVQFLLLNDFRLSVPVEELEAYGTMLVEFYAREVVAQRQSDRMEGVLSGGGGGVETQTPTPP